MIVNQIIEWHDISKDPEDLPKESGPYMVTLFHTKDKKLLVDVFDTVFDFNGRWKTRPTDDLYSYSLDYENDWDDCEEAYPHVKIIAWAKIIEPDIFEYVRGGRKEMEA